jgi:hypothetical protein
LQEIKVQEKIRLQRVQEKRERDREFRRNQDKRIDSELEEDLEARLRETE